EHLEHDLERAPVRLVLDERGAQRVLERFAVFDRDVGDRLHRVAVLGGAHRQPCLSKLLYAPHVPLEHGGGRWRPGWRRFGGDGLGHDGGSGQLLFSNVLELVENSLVAFRMSLRYLSKMLTVSVAVCASMCSMLSSTRVRAQSMVSLTDGAFFNSS